MPVLESKLVKALKSSDSLRTTVPSAIVTLLEVEAGDSLVWKFDPSSRSVAVTKSHDGVEPKNSSKV